MKTVTAYMEKFMMSTKQKDGLPGMVAYAVFSGVCGTLLLVMFCAAFLDLYQVLKYLPWMIAFNTAMTGFSLIEKTRDRIVHKHVSALCAGLVNVVLTSGILTIFSFYLLGENLLGSIMILFLLIIGAVCSELGAWLAVKYFKLDQKTT